MGHGAHRWLVPVVVAVVAAIVGSGLVILFVDTGTAASASITLEPAASTGLDPFTRSVAIGEVADFPTNIAPITRTITAKLATDTTTGGLTTTGTAPGLYGGTGNTGVCNPHQLADYLTHTPAKAAAWAATLGITTKQIPGYIARLTPVVLTTDTRVTNHGYARGAATPRQSVLQAGTAVLVDDHGIPRVKCGCGNPLTEPTSQPITTTTGTPWTGYRTQHVTTITPAPTPTTNLTLTNITTGRTYTQPTGTTTGGGTLLAATYDELGSSSLLESNDGGRSWTPQPPTTSGVEGDGVQLMNGGGRWLAIGSAHQGGLGYASLIGSSTDGRTWSPPVELQDAVGDAAYGDRRWIAVGGAFDQTGTTPPHGVMYVSSDGQRWAPEPTSGLPSSTELDQWTWQSIAFGDGKWAALASECSHAQVGGILHCQSALFRSNDGHHWTDSTTRFAGYALIRFGGGSWIVTGPPLQGTIGDQLTIATSRDLSTWRAATVPTPAGIDPEHGPRPSVVFAGNAWILAANADGSRGPAQLFSSRDGQTWTTSGSFTDGIDSLAYGGATSDVTTSIAGDWSITYGAPTVVTISRSRSGFTMTAKRAVRVVNSSCDLTAGTTLASFASGTGDTRTGQHGLWNTGNCSFARWAAATLTQTDASTLRLDIGNGENHTLVRLATAAR